MVMKSNDQFTLAHITLNSANYYYVIIYSQIIILTTSALRDCEYSVY